LVVETYSGDSSKTLKLQPDKSFDLIYIDGSHTYEGVLADTIEAIRIVEQNGILIFNDYTMYDHYLGHRYGVVEVVNQLVHQTNFKVFAFALQADMFCDIALRRL
jgi:precorrin-6B methylase 2